VLRLSPTKVDVQLLEAAQDAWAGHNPQRTPWDKEQPLVDSERYGLKVDNVVSMKHAKDALRMRRIMGKPFAKKFLQDQEDIFKDGTRTFIRKIEELRKLQDGKVDVYAEFGNYAFDVLSTIPFCHANGKLKLYTADISRRRLFDLGLASYSSLVRLPPDLYVFPSLSNPGARWKLSNHCLDTCTHSDEDV
jgi:hypothetical protein